MTDQTAHRLQNMSTKLITLMMKIILKYLKVRTLSRDSTVPFNILTLIGKFPGHELDRFLENSSKIEYLVEKRHTIPGHATDRFLENSSKYGQGFQKSV